MYKEKYLKYKTKYLDLKNQLGGDPDIIQDGGNFIYDFFSNLSNRIYPKATKKATEKTTKDNVPNEKERLPKINDITINIAQTLHPDALISDITEAMESANKKYMESINRNPVRQAVNKEYEDAINNGETMDEAMFKAIDKASSLGDKNDLTEWQWFYSLKRQKESHPSFNYLQDKNGFIIWTGWTNNIATATNYMANRNDYLIDKKSGQIRKIYK